MTKEFAPYIESLELKELGFDEPCFGYYDIKDNNLKLFSNELVDASCNSDLKYDDFKHCTAPLYQQAFKWFREKGLHSAIMPKITPSNITVYYIYEGKPKKDWNNCFETYEEAELACLNKLIQIVKNEIIALNTNR